MEFPKMPHVSLTPEQVVYLAKLFNGDVLLSAYPPPEDWLDENPTFAGVYNIIQTLSAKDLFQK